MRAEYARVALLLRRLAGCAIATCCLGTGGVAPLSAPASIVAAHTFIQLRPLLDRHAARVCMEWAAVACGGVLVAGLLTFPASSRNIGLVVSVIAVSVTFSLYALGLASWIADRGDGRPARQLRGSVALWWLGIGTGGLALHRTEGPVEVILTVGPGLIAGLLLIWCHMLVRLTMEQRAEEPVPVSR